MARIFISYSRQDAELVHACAGLLREAGHDVLIDDALLTTGSDIRSTLTEAIRSADAMIVFLTESGAASANVISEIGLALSLSDKMRLIPLVRGKVKLPYTMEHLLYQQIEGLSPGEITGYILHTLNQLFKSDPGEGSTPSSSRVPGTPGAFSRGFYNYLDQLNEGTQLEGWRFRERTGNAYNTPGGSWAGITGFVFEHDSYSFTLRSIWNAGDSRDGCYLVVESNRMRSQLANVDLDNSNKFINEDGFVTIKETFDMTAGGGRQSRSVVMDAFARAGMEGDVITAFFEKEFNWPKVLLDILRWAAYREEAKKIILGEAAAAGGSAPGQPLDINFRAEHYWWLSFSGVLESLQDSYESKTKIHIPYSPGMKDDKSAVFYEANEGDIGWLYDRLRSEMRCSFRVVQNDYNNDEGSGEILFVIEQLLLPPLSRTIIEAQYDLNLFLQDNDQVNRLFALSAEEHQSLLLLAGSQSGAQGAEAQGGQDRERPMPVFNKPSLSQVFADSADRKMEDQLGFKNDVEALAAVIAYREVKPPLAIGLFGNWGTGKSFFMNKLQQKIEGLTGDKGSQFCKKVLQVNFNSWHYSDANLWASLITKIFEDLEAYGKAGTDDVDKLFKNLNSTQELLQHTRNKEAELQKDLTTLKAQKEIFTKNAKRETERLDNLTFREILGGLLKDGKLKEDFSHLKKEFAFLRLKEYDEMEQNIGELSALADKSAVTARTLTGILKGKGGWLVFLLFVLLSLSMYTLLQYKEDFLGRLAEYKAYVAGLAGALSTIALTLRPFLKLAGRAHKSILSLNETVKGLRAKAGAKFEQEKEEQEKRVSAAQQELESTQTKIDLLEAEKKRLEEDIKDISTGKKIMRFIESRVTDERYINSLGIISWVRKDFEQLDRLLVQQKAVQNKQGAALVQAAKEFDLERIILYIDDLDRCKETTVVKVLEAIHLLLAFPLFVVVVGVDPRWVHRALSIRYHRLLTGNKDTLQNGLTGQGASSYDYLEKIFQIPFALKPMTDAGKQKIIREQLQDKAKEAVAANPVIPAATGTDSVEPVNDATAPAIDAGGKEPPHTGTQAATPLPGNDTLTAAEQQAEQAALLDLLKISEEEILFIEQVAFMIGESPRTLKRYINIYRIVRTHAGFETDSGGALHYYYAAILLLAVVTGIPHQAASFLGSIKTAQSEALFAAFLSGYLQQAKEETALLQVLSQKLKEDFYEPEHMKHLFVSHFQRNMELISRFSFY